MNNHTGALRHAALRNGFSNTRATACNDDHFVLQTHWKNSLWFVVYGSLHSRLQN
jgi:hypothetical protein